MKRELQVGDRVRVRYQTEKGTVTFVEGLWITVLIDGYEASNGFTRDDLIYLLPRKKPCPPQGERLEQWAEVDSKGRGHAYYHGGDAERICKADLKMPGNRVAHLVELKPGEIITKKKN